MSEKAGRWFVSLQCEQEIPDPVGESKPNCGVDLGIKTLATVSDGMTFDNPRALKKSLVKIKRLQRIVSRRTQGSANRQKAVYRLAKAHQRVANIRKNALHQVTTYLAKTKSEIVLEELNVSGILKNHRLAMAISDVGLYEFKRQILYKSTWYGSKVRLAPRFYPSSKKCSRCGQVKTELSLGERSYYCKSCGLVLDRDLNAAINLAHLIQTTDSSSECNACGEVVRPLSEMAVLYEAGTEPQSALCRFV